MARTFSTAPRSTLGYYERRRSLRAGSSSVFTALGGHETGLTKGLAAVLADEKQVLAELLQFPDVAALLQEKLDEILRFADSVSVQAEELQSDGKRRDIVVRFYGLRGHICTLIIEAKAEKVASTARSSAALLAQVQSYIAGVSDFDEPGDYTVGITLTRVRSLAQSPSSATVTWSDLMQICLMQKAGPGNDYGRHLLRTSSLRYYEIEVYSVPAGETLPLIWNFGLHAEPQRRRPRAALYLAPRAPNGGRCAELYRIQNTFDLDLDQRTSELARLRQDDANLASKVGSYLTARRASWNNERGVLRFYELQIPGVKLTHEPRPPVNTRGAFVNYKLADYLDPANVVLPALP